VPRAWSQSPFPWIIHQPDLGAPAEVIGERTGFSRRISRLQEYPDWILKEYWTPRGADDTLRLDRLIRLPERMPLADKELVDAHTSWPAARVINGQQLTIGVLIPLAPDSFRHMWRLPSGRVRNSRLDIDVLALTEDEQVRRGLAPQSLYNRILVCSSFAAVGALLERSGLVYLDWSYANVFWSIRQHSSYVIDLDDCSFGPRRQLASPSWEDPLEPLGAAAGNASDRYRIALLVARCLTGMRLNAATERKAIDDLREHGNAVGRVAQLLRRALGALKAEERPSVTELSGAIDAAKESMMRDGNSLFGPTAPVDGGGRNDKGNFP
jgi:hypothetical protein